MINSDHVLCLLTLNQAIFWPYKPQFWYQEKCEWGWTRKPRTQQCKNAGQCGLIAGSVMALVGIDVTKSCLALAYWSLQQYNELQLLRRTARIFQIMDRGGTVVTNVEFISVI
jgi:hypothetical protein